MFVQKANPYHDPKTGRFTHAPTSARAAASAATPYGAAYQPAANSILKPDGSLDIQYANDLADSLMASGATAHSGFGSDKGLEMGRELQGFNGKPHVVTVSQFESLEQGSWYRGDQRPEYSEQLKTGKFFGNGGIHGNGTYASNDRAEALQYTVPAGGLIRFKMHPDARVAYTGTGPRSISALGEKVRIGMVEAHSRGDLSMEKYLILQTHFGDYGRLGTALGMDAYFPAGRATEHIVILNRTAMVIADEPVTG